MFGKARLQSLGQNGMVSIIVTMILIIVMTLVVLGMSRNAITEQRQALDRQLSDQAFYNAESGINDWANYLYKTAGLPNEKTTCSNAGFAGSPSPQIGTDGTNSYTCLLYDRTPPSIVFGELDPSEGKTVPITPSASLRRLVFNWSSTSTTTTTTGCNSVSGGTRPTSLPGNCNVGGVKVDLVDPAGISRDNLINNNFISYFLPNNSAGGNTSLSSARGATNQGQIGIARCTNNVGCTMTVDIDTFGAAGLPANSTMYLHLRSLYLPVNNLTVTGFTSTGLPVDFIGSQIQIDSTGKANDVLRRVQVRLPATSQYEQTDFSLRTVDSICKLISVNRDAATPVATIDPVCL